MNLPSRSTTITLRSLPTILLFGDSLTEFAYGQTQTDHQIGWASLLASTYSRRADVLNRGYSGYNTQHALEVLPSVLGNDNGPPSENGRRLDDGSGTMRTTVLFTTVFFGANDASLPTARQHLPLDQYCRNMREIIRMIRTHTTLHHHHHQQQHQPPPPQPTPIVLFTPPPVAPKAWDYFCTVTSPRPLSPRSNTNVKLYGTKLQQIATETNCPVVDTYRLLGGDKGEDYYSRYLVDGIHLNSEGNRLVYDGLMEVIREELGDRGILPLEDGVEDRECGVPLDQKLWSEMC